MVSNYSLILGLRENGYGVMPRIEETLASSLTPNVKSSLKALTLPTKPNSYIFFGGQSLYGGKSGWSIPAHDGHLAMEPGQPVKRP